MNRYFIQVWRDRSAYPKTKRNRDLDRPIILRADDMAEAESEIATARATMSEPESIMPFLRADIYHAADWANDPFTAKPIRTIT